MSVRTFPELPLDLQVELKEEDIAACEQGRFEAVAERLRRKAWWGLSLGALPLGLWVIYAVRRWLESGRPSFLSLLFVFYGFELWRWFTATRRRSDQVLAWGRRESTPERLT